MDSTHCIFKYPFSSQHYLSFHSRWKQSKHWTLVTSVWDVWLTYLRQNSWLIGHLHVLINSLERLLTNKRKTKNPHYNPLPPPPLHPHTTPSPYLSGRSLGGRDVLMTSMMRGRKLEISSCTDTASSPTAWNAWVFSLLFLRIISRKFIVSIKYLE